MLQNDGMARPRHFDEQAVLDAAMDVFRRSGYARVSVADLERATGLSTSSLYNAFGDKTGVYRQALAHYVDGFMTPRLTAYAGSDASLEDLERLFTTLVEPPLDDGFGCLLVNAATEFAGRDSLVADGVRSGIERVAASFRDVLVRELGDGPEVRAEQARLLMLYLGLLVLIRSGLDETAHLHSIRAEFTRLRGQRDSKRGTS